MKVLFVYPNCININWIPLGIANLSAILKEKGIAVKLFDTTFYNIVDMGYQNSLREGEKQGQYIKTDFREHVNFEDITFQDLLERYNQVLDEFKPDLIAVSAMSQFYQLAVELVRRSNVKLPVIFGGVHPTISPEEVISDESVDIICIGEGEHALAELCDRMINDQDYTDIRNLWVKKNGKVFKNELRNLTDIDQTPRADLTIFDDRYFYQPFLSSVYRIVPHEIQRGCPYSCSYCTNQYFKDLYKGLGRYWRRKSFSKAIAELGYFKQEYNLEIVRFVDDTFLALSNEELRELANLYLQNVDLPFFIYTRPETVTREKVEILKEMKCVSVSIGLESGNEKMREEVLNRHISNEEMITAFEYLREANIRTSSFNMIGLPYESRRTIFETIELNRKCKPDTVSVFIFYPYKCTQIRDICLKENFIKGDEAVINDQVESILRMPSISSDEIKALKNTFSLYVSLPKILYPLIRICEEDNLLSRFLYPFFVGIVARIQRYRRSTRIINSFLKDTFGH